MGIFFALLGIIIILSRIMLGGDLGMFIDLPSICIVLGITVCFSFASHSVSGTVKAFAAAITLEKQSPAEVGQHIRVLSTVRVLANGSGVLGMLIGFVNMLANLADPSAIGPAMAVALLTALYAVLIAEVLVAPLMNRLRNNNKESLETGGALTTSVITVAVIPMSLLCFSILLIALTNVFIS